MASIGHVAVALAASRYIDFAAACPRRRFGLALAFSALSLLPDADVIGFSFGIKYSDPWGHRGASHSMALACAVGLMALPFSRRMGVSRGKTFLLVAALVMSHGLLDTLTDGGLGCALLWPLTHTRFFAPWQPLPVAPIGLGFLSLRGLEVSLIELAYFAAPLAYGLWPLRKARKASVADGGP